MKTVHVAAAILCDRLPSPSRVFATARGYGEQKGGWEFPGGKVEPGETEEQALEREICEELAIRVSAEQLLCRVEYDYPAFHLSMACFLCLIREGTPVLREATDAKWLSKAQLYSVAWLPADESMLGKLESIMESLPE